MEANWRFGWLCTGAVERAKQLQIVSMVVRYRERVYIPSMASHLMQAGLMQLSARAGHVGRLRGRCGSIAEDCREQPTGSSAPLGVVAGEGAYEAGELAAIGA